MLTVDLERLAVSGCRSETMSSRGSACGRVRGRHRQRMDKHRTTVVFGKDFRKLRARELRQYADRVKRSEEDLRQRVEARTRLAGAVGNRRDLVQARLAGLLARVSARRHAAAAQLSLLEPGRAIRCNGRSDDHSRDSSGPTQEDPVTSATLCTSLPAVAVCARAMRGRRQRFISGRRVRRGASRCSRSNSDKASERRPLLRGATFRFPRPCSVRCLVMPLRDTSVHVARSGLKKIRSPRRTPVDLRAPATASS